MPTSRAWRTFLDNFDIIQLSVDSMDHEQLDFASYIWRALKSGGWDDLEDGGEPAYEAGNFQMGFPYTVAAATDKYQPFDTY